MLQVLAHFSRLWWDLLPFVRVFLVLQGPKPAYSVMSAEKREWLHGLLSVVADAVSLCGWHRALVTPAHQDRRTPGSLQYVVFVTPHKYHSTPPCFREKSEVFKKRMASVSASSCPPLVESECITPEGLSRLLHLLFGVLLGIFWVFFHHPKARKGSC